MTKPYTREEVEAALKRVCPHDVSHVLLHLDEARIDRRQRAALGEMHRLSSEMEGTTGAAWLALQERFTVAMAEADQAEKDAEALYATQGKATP
jgi:plasmid maintenance system antidote protein VapI